MNFRARYNRDNYINFFRNQLLPEDFLEHTEKIPLSFKPQFIKSVVKIGNVPSLDLNIYEMIHVSENDPRVSISRDAFRLLAEYDSKRALVLFISETSSNFRLSFVTIDLKWEGGHRIQKEYSNPRRFSFFLGPETKIHTPEEYLAKLGRVKNLEDLKKRFSIEVVNQDFYNKISTLFTTLAGGHRFIASKKFDEAGCLHLPSTSDHKKKQEFATRLLGRIIFCWFLKKKKSAQGIPIITDDLLSAETLSVNKNYYHTILEPLFFLQLNTPPNQRNIKYATTRIPFLNGGLFQPHNDDFYELDELGISRYFNTLVVPDNWFDKLFEVLETYNFTIDESTSIDVDLSIDPEILGRIFENLLAEINPETGESARKATGSYYTPRQIVEYMVDEALKHYLEVKTGIGLERLSLVLSYGDGLPELSPNEISSLTEALFNLKIIDPACGSGAFPMAILQKVVLILQKVDPDSTSWLNKQISRIEDSYLHKVLEEKLQKENLNYIRKLGVVQNTIYGIDIQPMAVEIAKLRFFLSLIVDDCIDDSKENRGIHSLPNLEFKFICANSLIELDDSSQNGFTQDKFFNAFEILTKNYFAVSDPNKKRDLQKGIEILIQKKVDDNFSRVMSLTKEAIIDPRFKDRLKTKHAMSIAVLSYEAELWQSYINIFKDEPVSFFNPKYFFPEVKDGFDIVIANPPYLGESGHKDLFRKLRQNRWVNTYYHGKMDIFYFFFHRSLDLIKEEGIVAFITTNYYITAQGAFKLRSDFHRRASVIHLVNFDELKIFPSALGQHNMITILRKGKKEENCKNCITKHSGLADSSILSSITGWKDSLTEYFDITQNSLYDTGKLYMRLQGVSRDKDDKFGSILEKVRSSGLPLGIICKINQGVVSGCDYVSNRNITKLREGKGIEPKDGIFIFDFNNARDVQIVKSFSQVERSLLRPFFKNSDIQPYYCKIKPTKLLLYINKNVQSIDNYPAIKSHLLKFKRVLDDRREVKQGKIKYYHLQWARAEDIFLGSKICVPYRSEINSFAYNEVAWFCRSDSYIITTRDQSFKLKYILSLLNSKLYHFWLYFRGKRKGKVLELFQIPLSEIPVKKISLNDQELFIKLVTKITDITSCQGFSRDKELIIKINHYKCQIDQMVYELYGLTPEEIEVVENFSKE